MKALHIALAVLGGALAGAATALLFAPKSGEETREDIRKFVKDKCPDLSKDRIDALVNRLQHSFKH